MVVFCGIHHYGTLLQNIMATENVIKEAEGNIQVVLLPQLGAIWALIALGTHDVFPMTKIHAWRPLLQRHQQHCKLRWWSLGFAMKE